MLRFAAAIAGKDLRVVFSGPGAIAQALLLGLLLIFIFSLSKAPGEIATPQEAAAIFWLSSAFCQVMIFNQLHAFEEINQSRQGLALAPAPVQGVWLGKALAGLALLFCCQLVFLPALVVFLARPPVPPLYPGVAGLCVADIGMAALGSLLGALTQGQSGRESLLGIVLFPLLAPLLLAAISLGALSLGAEAAQEPGKWLGIAAAFDAIFIAAALVLFGFLYRGDE